MKNLLIALVTLFSFLSSYAQTPTIVAYRSSTLPGGSQVVMAIYSDGSRKQVSSLPTDAVTGRKGGIVRLPYAPEDKRQFNAEQFGTGKYYSPTFGFTVDFNPGPRTPAQLKAIGVNRFSEWTISITEKESQPFGDGMLYLTESSFNFEYEGAKYYESSLAEYEAKLWNTIPALGVGVNQMFKYLVFNIEQSNGWGKGNYGANQFWPSWDSHKGITIQCESDGQFRTLEQIDQQGLWGVETAVRRTNRLLIAFKVARAKSAPGLQISYGASMYQGLPRVDFKNSTGIFQPGFADVSHIGGSGGSITLNGRTYTGMNGNQWDAEDFMTGYYYLFNFDISRQDYTDIWVNKLPQTQNYPYLWSKIKLRHIVADEKGYLQLNRARMQTNQGKKRGILRMQEPIYEGNGAGVVDNTYINDEGEAKRLPFADVQTSVTGQSDAPKIWQPPYLNYSRYCVTRFFAGNDPGWGFFMFPDNAVKTRVDLSAAPEYNLHLHAFTSIYQARADMQPYEQFYTGSILVEDPEVQINGTGGFSAYDGTDAYNYSDGVTGVQKPAYMLRYKPTSTGWRVVILGGMNQGYTDERTDIIRVPGGGLNGNLFKVKLRGPAAQVYEFAVKNTDNGQVYEALPAANTGWEKPGYAGRVGAITSTTTTTTGGTSTTSVATTTIAYNDKIQAENATGTGTYAGTVGDLTVKGPYRNSGEYLDYQLNAPGGGVALLGLRYQTNFGSSESGQGTVLVNGVTVQDFTLEGAEGGNRLVNFSVSLNPGVNTVRVQGKSNTFFQDYITIAGTLSTTVTTSGSTTTTTTTPGTTTGTLAGLPEFNTFGYNPPGGSTNWPSTDSRNNDLGMLVGDYVEMASPDGYGYFRVGRNWGACLYHISGPDHVNMINIHDAGTLNGLTLYRGGAKSDKGYQLYDQTPNDPIQSGDIGNSTSEVVDLQYSNGMVYTKTKMLNWPTHNEVTDVILEQWAKWRPGTRAIDVWHKITFNRVVDKAFYDAFAQEYPDLYARLDFRTLAYKDANNNVQFLTGQSGQLDVPIAKPVVALVDGGSLNSKGLGIFEEGIYLSTQWQKNMEEGGNEFKNGSGYTAMRPFIHADWNGVWYGHHAFVVGSAQQILDFGESQPDPRNAIKWKFNTRNGRGWYIYKNGIDTGFPCPSDGVEITKQGSGEFYVQAPYMAIPANTVSTIYIKYKSTGFGSTWSLIYNKFGQQDITALQNGQIINFSTQNDDQWHTVAIPTNNWSGVISKLRFSNDGAANGSKIKIAWINTVNSEPVMNDLGAAGWLLLSLLLGAIRRKNALIQSGISFCLLPGLGFAQGVTALAEQTIYPGLDYSFNLVITRLDSALSSSAVLYYGPNGRAVEQPNQPVTGRAGRLLTVSFSKAQTRNLPVSQKLWLEISAGSTPRFGAFVTVSKYPITISKPGTFTVISPVAELSETGATAKTYVLNNIPPSGYRITHNKGTRLVNALFYRDDTGQVDPLWRIQIVTENAVDVTGPFGETFPGRVVLLFPIQTISN